MPLSPITAQILVLEDPDGVGEAMLPTLGDFDALFACAKEGGLVGLTIALYFLRLMVG